MLKEAEPIIDEGVLAHINGLESRESIASLSSKLLNALMVKEREIYLREQADNKANGYYDRSLACALGKLGLSIPRDRNNNFRPAILPDGWQRADESLQDLVINLILQSYSPNRIKAVLQGMNLPYSAEQIEEIKNDLYLKSKELRSKELPEKTACIFIDAYHTGLKDDDTAKVKKSVIYSIIGIDLEGKKDLYGYYIMQGHETREDWISIFNDLITRGLKRPMLIISDDFTGLSESISSLFPKSEHQLCYVHLQRNVKRNLGKIEAKEFNSELSLIRRSKTQEQALEKFKDLCTKFKDKNKTFIDYISKKANLYFNFLNYPEPIRKHIYTTNIIENFNSRLEVLRVNSGGYFQSTKTVEIAIFVQANKLKNNRWYKPINSFREAQYELNQIFNTKFFPKEVF